MGLFSSSEFDELTKLVEKATSEYIPAAQEDLALNLEITDVIKSKRVNPKDALRLLLIRLTHDNPNVQLLTLQLLDKCVKNGGKHFLVEMAGREFVDVAVSMMDDNEYGHECNHLVQERLIELFQEWALIFQSDPSLTYLSDTYSALKSQKRVYFPAPAKSLDQVDPLSIVSSLAPPDWNDSPTCQRCRDSFTLANRKHHCRKCGGTFCHLCSSNEAVLLDMGITDPVRVCDSCYRSPVEKRKSRIFENDKNTAARNQDQDASDPDLKKAIELSLLEEKRELKIPETEIDADALKKAIEASLKEAGPNHMVTANSNIAQIKPLELAHFNAVELENILMFHQLIGRLIRTRPALTPEDASDLKKLATEMRALQKRPIEDNGVKSQLEEGIKGYELLFEPSPVSANAGGTVPSPPLSVTNDNNSETSKDLNQMKTEVFGMGTVRTRFGSLSLEKVNTESVNYPSVPIHTVPNTPLHNTVPIQNAMQMISPPPIQIPFHNVSTPLQPLTNTQSHFHNTPPIQMCPEMTIHPHPAHPFSHENPYAVVDKKEKKKEKEKKEGEIVEKEKKDRDRKKKEKDESKEKEKEKKKKRRKKKEKAEKESNKKKEKLPEVNPEKHKDSKEDKDQKKGKGSKKQKKSQEQREPREPRNEQKEKDHHRKESIEDVGGRKSPINLIDL